MTNSAGGCAGEQQRKEKLDQGSALPRRLDELEHQHQQREHEQYVAPAQASS
jgi:hypothetical protein